ncbi:MAG: hypothetical protein V4683_06415 [Bacteroidota bacterium]
MKKLFRNLCYLTFCLGLFACKKEEEIDPCILNPLETNSTLKRIVYLEEKHNMDSCSINLVSRVDASTKLKEYFFVVTNGSPILNYHFIKNAQIINCNGRDIGEFYVKSNYEEFFSSVKFEKKIWKKDKRIPIETAGTCGTLTPLKDIVYFQNLNTLLDKYAWKSAIYQYKYQNQTLYYGLYTAIDQKENKYASLAAMDCSGKNLQDSPSWNQVDFLENAVLERQIR